MEESAHMKSRILKISSNVLNILVLSQNISITKRTRLVFVMSQCCQIFSSNTWQWNSSYVNLWNVLIRRPENNVWLCIISHTHRFHTMHFNTFALLMFDYSFGILYIVMYLIICLYYTFRRKILLYYTIVVTAGKTSQSWNDMPESIFS